MADLSASVVTAPSGDLHSHVSFPTAEDLRGDETGPRVDVDEFARGEGVSHVEFPCFCSVLLVDQPRAVNVSTGTQCRHSGCVDVAVAAQVNALLGSHTLILIDTASLLVSSRVSVWISSPS